MVGVYQSINMHKALVIITVLAFVSGIGDLVLNVAILSKVSGKPPVTAIETMYKAPVTPTASITATPTASVSATPAVTGKALLRVTAVPTKTISLTPVPSHVKIK